MDTFFKAMKIFGIVSEWATKALADGKVTVDEALSLARQVAEVLGIPLEWEIGKEKEV